MPSSMAVSTDMTATRQIRGDILDDPQSRNWRSAGQHEPLEDESRRSARHARHSRRSDGYVEVCRPRRLFDLGHETTEETIPGSQHFEACRLFVRQAALRAVRCCGRDRPFHSDAHDPATGQPYKVPAPRDKMESLARSGQQQKPREQQE